MKTITMQPALQTALLLILAFVFSAASQAQDTVDFSKRSLEAKIEYCKACHGLSGQGYRGFFPMPRIAGQQAEYFESQLQAFDARRRENKYMYEVSHVLSPAMRTALAKQFGDLNPKPLGGAPRNLIATGKKIYDEGDPATDVPPCASCHGPQAKGSGEIPRLAGQLHDYTFNKLVNWSKERGLDPANPDASAIMEPIAHGLTKPQIEAVAAYLSYLD
jgi:cytochrome c553